MGGTNLKQKTIRGLLSVSVLAAMGVTSFLSNEREIIFPETLALLTGAWIVREMPWNCRHGQFTVVMTVAALFGVCISRYMPLPLVLKAIIAFGATCALLYFAKTALSPAVSACVLPVMLGTKSIIYVVTVFCITGIIDAGRFSLEQSALVERKAYIRPDKKEWKLWILRFLVCSAFISIPLICRMPYFVVPPVLVAFVAMSDPNRKEKHHPVGLAALFLVCGALGTSARILGMEKLGIAEPLLIVVTSVAVWALMKMTKRYFPPAGAAALLPFLLPVENLWWYPLEESAGILIMFCAAQVVFTLIKISTGRQSSSLR